MARKFFWWAMAALQAIGCGLFLWTAATIQNGELRQAAILIAVGPALLAVLAVGEARKKVL